MTSSTVTDPASRSAASWSGRLAYLYSRGRGDDDPDVIECREALAYWRISRAVDAEAGHLGRPGVDRLVSQLRGAAAR
jgi:hypothetical protein